MSSLLSRRWAFALAATLWLAAGCRASAAPGLPDDITPARTTRRDLTEVGLEELMNIEVVSISKREQKLARTPAAVTVLTQEDIRRSGATSIPEVLRLVPGMQLARIDDSHWAVSARGFNGQYSNKLLVMIDGRTVYTPLFSGVYWDMQDLLLEDIERIEVIRGPGASLWGANAVNGVINILTKTAQETQGALAVLGVGNAEKSTLGFRYGGKLGPAAHYRVYSKYTQREFLWREPASAPGSDWLMGRSGFRMDWDVSSRDAVSFESELFKSRSHEVLDAYTSEPPFTQSLYDRVDSSGGHARVHWRHQLSSNSDLHLAFYYDRYRREEATLGETRDTLDFDFQHRFGVSARHQILWGVEQRYTRDHIFDTAITQVVPNRRGENLFSAFWQDEVSLAPDRWYLTLGSKFEYRDFTGFEVQPTARLLWLPRENQAAWAAVSRAVRSPSRGEQDGTLRFPARSGPGGLPLLLTYDGNRDLGAESLVAYEAGYRVQVASRFSVEAAAFYNFYQDLLTAQLGAPAFQPAPAPHLEMTAYLQHGMRGETYGAEVAANWRPFDGWRLSGAYTGLRTFLHPAPGNPSSGAEASENSSPHHQFSVASYLDLSRRLQFDTIVYHVGALSGLRVPAYTRCDVRLGWRLRESLDLSLGAQDLVGRRHLEFVSETFVHPSRIGRSIYGKLTWAF